VVTLIFLLRRPRFGFSYFFRIGDLKGFWFFFFFGGFFWGVFVFVGGLGFFFFVVVGVVVFLSCVFCGGKGPILLVG